MVAVTSLRKDVIVSAVRRLYTEIAQHPDRTFHVPTGRQACAFVGYPEARLDQLPAWATESFAGVGYPFIANVIRAGDVVLDIGSGSGTDLLHAAQDTGERGEVIGLDLTPAMLAKVKRLASEATTVRVRLLEGHAEQIPLPDASVDVVTSNGVFNLVPDKRAAFAEVHRVLRPGGRVQIADIAVGRPLTGECATDPTLWAECIVGATLIDEYEHLLHSAGFAQVEYLGQIDYFAGSPSAATRSIAGSFRACSCVFRAAKAPAAPLPPARVWAMPAATADVEPPAVTPQIDATLDVLGVACGAIEPAMKRVLRTLAGGQVLEVRADDPAARLGLPAWIRLTGHTLLATIEDDETRTRFFVRKR
jgi:SAM-dependent methyltransferase/TusA-related sulfurtransferase